VSKKEITMRLCTVGRVVTLALAVFVAPLVVAAQQPGKVYRIGFLSARLPPLLLDVFRQQLHELGWIEGQNIVIEYRSAERRFDRLPALATELVQQKVDLILVGDGAAIVAAKQATSTIPIVMFSSVDAVEQGFIASLAHPGANVTGLTTMTADLEPKRLELLKETVPGSSRMTVLRCKDSPGTSFPVRRLEAGMEVTARALGVHLQQLLVQEPDDYQGAFAAASRERAAAMVVPQCYLNAFNLQRIVDLAAQHRLPAIYSTRAWVQAGGLMSYGPSGPDMARRAATYVDKVLKGAKPADLPVEQPTKFELVLNLKTAEALGLTLPPHLLVLADEVIQ
jgi:putative ABC transport system substrate-binding protein